jgi:NodT family efflux transporter outer membrane factor (OMF) lipoprotein
MKSSLIRVTALVLVLSVLAGCSSATRSDFEAPELSVPTQWNRNSDLNNKAEFDSAEAENVSAIEHTSKWWQQFQDPELNQLIERVFNVNNDLALATITLQKARLEAGLSQNAKIPTVSGEVSSSYEKELDSGDTDISHSPSVTLSYELDLWGRVSAAADAKQWLAMASQEDRESTAQSLAVTTASLYWKIGYLKQRLALTQQNIEGVQNVVTLTQSMFNAGSVTKLDVLESTQSLYGEQLTLSELQQELTETENALSILVNQPLQETGLRINTLPDRALPMIATGIPSDLLLRRPDVRASLAELKSALADNDEVNAGYFPTLTLTGSLSTSSSNLLQLLDNPVLTLGSGITLPFLKWEEMKINKAISSLDYQTAVINYRDTLYQAFEDVANLLSAKHSYYVQGEILNEQLMNAQEIERIYASKYRHGASDMIDWITAMESRRTKESSMLENKYDQLVNQVTLYQSLGGSDVIEEK